MRHFIKKAFKNEKGLTLIELLAVIVILGVIAAIAVPVIGGLINDTKDEARSATAIQIYEAARLYSTVNPDAGNTITLSQLGEYFDKPLTDPKDGTPLDGTTSVNLGARGSETAVTLKSATATIETFTYDDLF